MSSYEQALADHTYLWEEYGPAADMTGCYVDQEDLKLLLQSPTKATARQCLVRQIEYWFRAGPAIDTEFGENVANLLACDPQLVEIAERYGA